MKGGSAGEIALTAYVVITMLENSDNVNVSEFCVHFYRTVL